jgi:hypothetical protein
MHSRSLKPPCKRDTGGSPSRIRASFRSARPRRSPDSRGLSSAPQSRRPSRVRGIRAPTAYGGNPRAPAGYRCGIRVATGTPSSSPAIAGASVRMSCTTTSGRTSATTRWVTGVARTTASYISNGSPAPPNSGCSGAGTNRIPAASTSSRHLDHVSNVTSWPRAARRAPSASIGKAWPGSPNAPRNTRSRSAGALKPPARPPPAAARSARGR